MLPELIYHLARHFTDLHVLQLYLFRYITFRTIMATLTALGISLLLSPRLIGKLTAMKASQVVRSNGPQTHLSKVGTPTMGGVMILFSVVMAALLWGDLRNHYVWIVLGCAAGIWCDWLL